MKIQAVVLDWAGTLADFGSRAPVAALESLFASAGVPITDAEARQSMGIAKRDHIQAILVIPRVHAAWVAQHGMTPGEYQLEHLYEKFIPEQIRALEEHSRLIPGVLDAMTRLRSRGIRIGTNTGYNREMLDVLLQRAAAQGFVPDSAVCPDDVPAGRPFPWMCYLSAIRLRAYPLWACVKIGDTPADIEEGRNAGMWTIGVTRSGNEIGVSEEEWAGFDAAEQTGRLNLAAQRLIAAGAHYTAPSAAECDSVLDDIEARLTRGEKP
jgi:phosphonoacetaldehyde hydrolase